MTEPAELAARDRWRAADDRLYPTLIANPTGYQQALTDIRSVVAELRRRGSDLQVLLAAEDDPEGVLASAGVRGSQLPVALLVGVACGVRYRELTARREADRVADVVASARSRGEAWATLAGPGEPEQLTDGRLVELHLESGTLLTATIDPWSGGPPFAVGVTPETGREMSWTFTDRDTWLADHARRRAAIESGTDAQAQPPAPAGSAL